MKKNKDKFNNSMYLKRKARVDEIYFLTVIDNSGLYTININNLQKRLITFGRDDKSDIVLNSENVDYQQGYFELTEYGILVINTSRNFGIVGNNNKMYDNFYLAEGGFLKIVNSDEENTIGAVMILSIGRSPDEWKQLSLQLSQITIGSGANNDIILPPLGVSKHVATIHTNKRQTWIFDQYSTNGIYINGTKIPVAQKVLVNNLDIIVIGHSKIVLWNNKLYYQISQQGIKLEAIDIVKKVRVKFKIKEISSHINMKIEPSEFVVFIGNSGSGKSTFMKAISGVDRPTSGTVLLNGEDLYENYDSLKYNIGYVPQDDIVFANLTLHDMLVYAAKLRMPDNTTKAERNERIREVLEIVSLSEFENSYIRQLSGGQRKRASIAVELIADPGLFFLDEPTSGLDPGTERSIMETLKSMSQKGKTIILVTHNTLNLHLCDKVAFFGAGGRLCFYGTPQEMLDFFGVDDFVDIYNLLNENMDFWYEKFQNTYKPTLTNESKIEKNNVNKVNDKKKSFTKQLINLIKRYIKLIANDLQQMLLLFAQAPIIAVLLVLVATEELYTNYKDTKSIMFALGCASIWLGLLNSVQEICKEKVILQKEYMADLRLPAYLLSKFIVQGILAFIQTMVMIIIFQNVVGQSEYSILIDGFWDISLICFLSILSSATLGLFISAIVKNSYVAMSIIPLILVPQLLLSGILFKLEGVTKFLSNFVLCRWSVEGLGTSVNLNDLTYIIEDVNPVIEVKPEAEDYFTFTTEHMLWVIGVIIIMTLVLSLGSYFVLKKNINKNI